MLSNPNTFALPALRQDVTVQVSALLENGSDQAFVAAQINSGGCHIASAEGVFFWIDTAGSWTITSDLGKLSTAC